MERRVSRPARPRCRGARPMSENTNSTQEQPPETNATEATPRKLYPTKAEAEANKPADASKYHKIFEVVKGGATVGYIWGRGYDNALAGVARIDGYAVSLGRTNGGPLTK